MGNIKHLYYISTRTNAVCNEFGSAIFGYYDYCNLKDDITRKEVAIHITYVDGRCVFPLLFCC